MVDNERYAGQAVVVWHASHKRKRCRFDSGPRYHR